MSDPIREALSELEDWKAGRRSWLNLGPNPPYTPDVIAVMDAQEVVKLSAYVQALAAPSDRLDVDAFGLSDDPVWGDLYRELIRSRYASFAEVIFRHRPSIEAALSATPAPLDVERLADALHAELCTFPPDGHDWTAEEPQIRAHYLALARRLNASLAREYAKP